MTTGVGAVGMGTGTTPGDVTGMSDVGDMAVTTGVGDVEMGTSAGEVMVLSDIGDRTVTTGVVEVETGLVSQLVL